MNVNTTFEQTADLDIALVGMSGRFAGAKNLDEFWHNLQHGVESVSFFSNDDLVDLNIEKAILNDPNYVKAAPVLEDIESFDARFFGFSPKEAEVIDPQQRFFMECAWEALENAGYEPETYKGLIGVYAGTSTNSYFFNNIFPNSNLINFSNKHTLYKDFISTNVSYKLNLKGPSIGIQTYCSTSLVAVHLACKSLLDEECDIALAGGVAIAVPQKSGYFYQEDGILSPDGHCRAFDAKAQGTIFGSGLGIIVLKRLKDAIADRDYIHAVIKGSAINNDGSLKVSYTAPSVNGQAEVIVEALANAGIDADDISYIETHGTGTATGDPVEIAALTKAFRTFTKKNGFCAIGSVKPNIGHLDTASGVASLIKTVLALKYKQIPPSLNFEVPNPQIDFVNSPFYVNTELVEWKANGTPRRAGVSSLGFGGTNAHIILEEAPEIKHFEELRPWHLLLLSAKTSSALETATANLVAYLKQHPDINLANVAHTLQVGRRAFNHRRVLVCQDIKDAVTALETQDLIRVFTTYQDHREQPVIFMFSGQGAQYVNMARELYQVEPTFRKYVDTCAQILQALLNLDIRHILFPKEEEIETASQQLQQTAITQSALFVIEYALAQLLMSWGVRPKAMIGHSIGEYVAATIAGVFSLEDALAIVATRGQLMQQLPTGSMLAIQLRDKDVQSLLDTQIPDKSSLQIAAINSPSSCVVSGTVDAIATFQNQLSSKGIECRLLHTSHAFHSVMMEPILEPFVQVVKKVKLNPPRIRFISNLTGTWITDEQATNPNYWGQHLRQPVKFSDGISQLLQQFEGVFLEIGPGRTLSTLTTQHLFPEAKQQVLTCLRHPQEQQSDVSFLLQTLGRLWLFGVEIDWSGFYTHEQRHRLPLPTYPFERQRYWIEPKKQGIDHHATPVSLSKKPDIADWFYIPFWKPSLTPPQLEHKELTDQLSSILVFIDEYGLGSKLVKQLQQQNWDVITVTVGGEFTKLNKCQYTINPQQPNNYDALIKELSTQQKLPKTIAHLWSVTPVNGKELELEEVDKAQFIGFYSLLFLAQALGRREMADEVQITAISNNLQPVTGTEKLCPQKATLLGPIKVISQEYSNIICRSIDVILPESGSWQEEQLVEKLLTELTASSCDQMIAYRGINRWVQSFEPVRFDKAKIVKPRLRQRGVYLITGGLGGIGLVVAEYLAQTVQAKLLLIGRTALPKKDEWKQWLLTHDETDSTSRKILKIQQLEQLGAEVLVVSADVSNTEQMHLAIAQAESQFGKLNGVVHAAGILGGQSSGAIEKISKTDCDRQFQPKVHGLIVLDKVLQDRELDFCLLLSSLSSVLGGLGHVAYSAANIFMDAFVHQHNQSHPVSWISVSWDSWQLEKENKQSTSVGASVTEFAFDPKEGVEAFQRILNCSEFNHVVVSTGELQARIDQWIKFESFQQKLASQPVNSLSLHPRPDLQNLYVAPENEIEQTIANIWQEVLGIKDVGLHDNFFELGGDSLLIIQVRSKLIKTLNKNLSIADLFEYSTINALAEYLGGQQVEEPTFQEADERASRKEAAMQEKRQLMKQRRKADG
ncbi:MAG: SDR family oxidoreductase [Nostoc sp.]|uniref:type I polyketide synthase n=1 Tax=Nostoc sp. TaxID=1180 RepID=UPI002FF4CAA0